MHKFDEVEEELDSRLRWNDNSVILGLDPGIHHNSDSDDYDDDEEDEDEDEEREWCD